MAMVHWVCLHNPSDTSLAESRKICCSMCKSMAKAIFYYCKSGRHVICENCQRGESLEKIMNADYVPEKECSPTNKKESTYFRNSESRQDFSCGDPYNTVQTYNVPLNNYEESSKSVPVPIISKTKGFHSKSETATVLYRNDKFNNRKSSTTTNIEYSMTESIEEHNSDKVSRPFMCPVTSCSKMVTIDSFLQHFNFDHSKVPRMVLNNSEPQECSLNCSMLNAGTTCIATFISKHNQRSRRVLRHVESGINLHNLKRKNELLLLMAAKISISSTPVKYSNTLNTSRYLCKKNGAGCDGNNTESIQDVQPLSNKSSTDTTIFINDKMFNEDNEIILLWLCRLNNKSGIYSITVLREDKQQGYSFIGDAVHIRNEHDPLSIYNRTECLSLRSLTIKKLVTPENELKIIINTVQ